MRLHVGLTSLIGSVERYAERFDLLELRSEPKRLPPLKTLRKLRGSAPNLVMSLLIPPETTGPALELPDRLQPSVEAADALNAAWVVVQTGAEFGPSQRGRQRLQTLLERINRDGRRLAWEPRGPWEPETAVRQAMTWGITLVQDLSVFPGTGEPLVYTRLRALGPGAALKSGALDHLAEEIAGAEEAVVVVEGKPSGKARARIARVVLGAAAEHDALTELEDDEDADDEEFEDEDEAGEDEDES
jgi:uncharacterized protein YecE (DUF72 family)